MPPRDPADVAAYDAELARVTIGGAQPLTSPIEIRDYDQAWPSWYAREEARIRLALGDRIARIEHVGSTSVPELAAKPIVDVVLEVPDSADEDAYVPDLMEVGYVLRIREPEWLEHRLLRRLEPRVNLHVFTVGCAEFDRMVSFRDWLRTTAVDRELYETAKRDLAGRDWKYVQQYADAKTGVIREILARAERRETRRRTMSQVATASMLEVAQAFFDACDMGKGWDVCQQYCTPDATFSAQAEPLADVRTLQQYTDWMKAILTPLPDGRYELKSFAADEERKNVVAYGIFSATHTGEGGPVPPTGKSMSTDYVYVMDFEGDRIRHMTKIWNAGYALNQLGWA